MRVEMEVLDLNFLPIQHLVMGVGFWVEGVVEEAFLQAWDRLSLDN